MLPASFTGAQQKGNPGKTEQANDGTLFPAKISEVPFRAKAKLLGVLDEKRVERNADVPPNRPAAISSKRN
jgi:transcriptional regulator with PAS, ATPase and Fis domain